MPTYSYECRECKHRFDKMQPISANPSRKCPKCGRLKLHRLIGSGAGIIFKGSGFYETDYKRKGESKPSKADAAPAKSEKTETKTEAKSDSKSEPKKSGDAPKPKKSKDS